MHTLFPSVYIFFPLLFFSFNLFVLFLTMTLTLPAPPLDTLSAPLTSTESSPLLCHLSFHLAFPSLHLLLHTLTHSLYRPLRFLTTLILRGRLGEACHPPPSPPNLIRDEIKSKKEFTAEPFAKNLVHSDYVVWEIRKRALPFLAL